jgi:hypothetical protein
MTRKLFIHIGHYKTGSSWLQAAFRENQDVLLRHGIWYPQPKRSRALAPTSITAGNAPKAGADPESFRAFLSAQVAAAPEPGASLLLSSETLFRQLWDWPRPEPGAVAERLWEVAGPLGFGEVHVLLFIRNPVSLAASAWQQVTKRSGNVLGIEDFFAKERTPEQVAQLARALRGHPGVHLTVLNYSVCKAELLEATCGWLGLDPSVLVRPAAEVINRSMTAGEIAMQLALNRVLGASARPFSIALCEQLPDVRADEFLPSLAAQEAHWRRNLPAIEEVNGFVDPDHRYSFDGREPQPQPDEFRFTRAQLEVAATALATEIARPSKKKARENADEPRERAARGEERRENGATARPAAPRGLTWIEAGLRGLRTRFR